MFLIHNCNTLLHLLSCRYNSRETFLVHFLNLYYSIYYHFSWLRTYREISVVGSNYRPSVHVITKVITKSNVKSVSEVSYNISNFQRAETLWDYLFSTFVLLLDYCLVVFFALDFIARVERNAFKLIPEIRCFLPRICNPLIRVFLVKIVYLPTNLVKIWLFYKIGHYRWAASI